RQRDVRHDPSATQRPIAYATLLNSAPAVKTRRFSTACYGRHAPIQAAIERYSPFLCRSFPW
ncbi:hypothetical protein RZS43_03460, partial [Burkholderia pseudomallei]|nr:hypothetical protein [Burkholderia pseudomallei]